MKEPQDINRFPRSKPIQPIWNTHHRQMRLEIHEGPGIYRCCGPAARTTLSIFSMFMSPVIPSHSDRFHFLSPFSKMNLDREVEPFRGPSYKQAWEDSTKVIRDLYQLLEKEVNNEADINAFQALRSTIRAYNNLVEQFQLQANIHLQITEEYNRLKQEIDSSMADLTYHLDNNGNENQTSSPDCFSIESHSFCTSPGTIRPATRMGHSIAKQTNNIQYNPSQSERRSANETTTAANSQHPLISLALLTNSI